MISLKIYIFCMSEFLEKKFNENHQTLWDQENSIYAFKRGFQLPKVKSPKKEEKEMKYTLAFHAEGKNIKATHTSGLRE